MLYIFLTLILISNISAMIDDKEKKEQAQTEEERISQEKLIEKVADAILSIKTENDKQSLLALEKILPKKKGGYNIKTLFKAIIKILHADSVKSNTKNEELIKKSYKAYLKTMVARESKEKGFKENIKTSHTSQPKPPKKKKNLLLPVNIECIKEALDSCLDEINSLKKELKENRVYPIFSLDLDMIIRRRQYIDHFCINITPDSVEKSQLKNLTKLAIIAHDRYQKLKNYFKQKDDLYEILVTVDEIINTYGLLYEEYENCMGLFYPLINSTLPLPKYNEYKSTYKNFLLNINKLCEGIKTFSDTQSLSLDQQDVENISLNDFIQPSEKTIKTITSLLKSSGYIQTDFTKILEKLKEKNTFDIRQRLDSIQNKILNVNKENDYNEKTKKKKEAKAFFEQNKNFFESKKESMLSYQKEKYEQLKKEVSEYPSESFIPWNKIVIGSLVAAVVGSVGYGLYKYFQNTKTSIIPKLRIPIKI